MFTFVPGVVRQQDDGRDLIFSAPVSATPLPSKVDLSYPELGSPFEPAMDQENLGSCGPNSAVGDMIYPEMAAGEQVEMLSRLFVYYNARKLMGTVNQDSGVDNRNLVKALAKWGACPERMWPYDINKFKVEPPPECYEAALANRIIQYRAVPQTLDAMRACLAGNENQQGRPFIFGFTVFASFNSQQTQQTGDVPDPSPGEQTLGGHDVLIVGYNDSTRRFKFKNSYSKRWGKNGYGTISYEYATNPQLAADFWTIYTLNSPPPKLEEGQA